MTVRFGERGDAVRGSGSPHGPEFVPAGVGFYRGGALAIVAIAGVTLFAFFAALRNEFVNWDDDVVLLDNEAFRGLSWEHLRWMFTTSHAGHYQPLTWLSFAIDHALWGGVEAFGVHLTNLILHVLTAVAFYFVARRLMVAEGRECGRHEGTKARRHEATGEPKHENKRRNVESRNVECGAVLAALFFAVHPLRVESVAWATERRDVLSGVLLMLTVIFYLRGVDASGGAARWKWLGGAVVVYVLSLLSKAVGMTLPLTLLVLDVYPLRRHPGGARASAGCTWGGLLVEKMPFVVPAGVIAVLAGWAQRHAGAMWEVAEHGIGLRIAQAFYGLFFYLWKTVWPSGLVPLYEQPAEISAFDARYVLAAGVVVLVSVILLALRKRRPAWPAAGVVYVITVAPMLGLAQSGPQEVADRYSYVACLPWAVLFGAGVMRLFGAKAAGNRVRRLMVGGAGVAVIGLLAMLTRAQVGVWADSETLWRTTIARAPRTGVAHGNLAALLNRRGTYAEAREHSLRALEILPGNRVAHLTLARAAVGLGDFATAEAHYEEALRIRPDDPGPMISLAGVKLELDKLDAAEALCRRLVELEPESATWRFSLGTVLARSGKREEAAQCFREALVRDPQHEEAQRRLDVLLNK